MPPTAAISQLLHARAIIGLVIVADRDLLLLVVGVVVCLSIALTAWWNRGQTWPQRFLIFVGFFSILACVAHVVFAYWVGVPFTRFDLISMTGDY